MNEEYLSETKKLWASFCARARFNALMNMLVFLKISLHGCYNNYDSTGTVEYG